MKYMSVVLPSEEYPIIKECQFEKPAKKLHKILGCAYRSEERTEKKSPGNGKCLDKTPVADQTVDNVLVLDGYHHGQLTRLGW